MLLLDLIQRLLLASEADATPDPRVALLVEMAEEPCDHAVALRLRGLGGDGDELVRVRRPAARGPR
jgi:hypothetical protein